MDRPSEATDDDVPVPARCPDPTRDLSQSAWMSQLVRPAFEQFASGLSRSGLGAVVGTKEMGCVVDVALVAERNIVYHASMSVSADLTHLTADFPEMEEPCAELIGEQLTSMRIVAALEESFRRYVARLDGAPDAAELERRAG